MSLLGFLFVALCVVEAIGIILIAFAPSVDSDGVEDLVLDPGVDSRGHFSVDMLGGGIISGDFSSQSGRSVLFMALDDGQYEDLLAGRAYDTHFSTIASSGEFSIDYAGMENCHIVVQHATDVDSPEQVTLAYHVSSSNWSMVFLGLGLFGGGGLLSGVILLIHGKDVKKRVGILNPYVDVVIFDEES